jgi:hypothetical protein
VKFFDIKNDGRGRLLAMSSDRLSNTIIAITAAAIILILFVVWFITPPSELPRAPWGMRSGKEEAFQMLVGRHTGGTKRNQNELLRISVFTHPSVARQYSVLESGEEFDAREVWNWATQDTVIRQLTPADLQEIRKAASQLPTTNDDPPVEQLVVISFWDGTRWLTRSYDTESLPSEMQSIFEVIHRRENRLIELMQQRLKENPPPADPSNQ